MNREELEHLIQEAIDAVSFVRVELLNGVNYNGFKIQKNDDEVIIGFTENQRRDQVGHEIIISQTIIYKNAITNLYLL